MNVELLDDWIHFCEGKKEFDDLAFESLLSEMYYDSFFTKEDKEALKTIFQYFPESTSVVDKLLKLDSGAAKKTDEQLIELVKVDLSERIKVIHQPSQQKAKCPSPDSCEYSIIGPEDHHAYRQIKFSDCYEQATSLLKRYFSDQLQTRDRKTRMICDAFFGIADNQYLQWSLTADLLKLDVDLGNYIDVYLAGADYAFNELRVVVMQR